MSSTLTGWKVPAPTCNVVNPRRTGDREGDLFRLSLAKGSDVWRMLEKAGQVPLPPYIERDAEAGDIERYQTVYARHPGAVAAPTAGLHFDRQLLDALTDIRAFSQRQPE